MRKRERHGTEKCGSGRAWGTAPKIAAQASDFYRLWSFCVAPGWPAARKTAKLCAPFGVKAQTLIAAGGCAQTRFFVKRFDYI
jgi:hypothetical protein